MNDMQYVDCGHEFLGNPGISSFCGNCGFHPIWKCPDCGAWVDNYGDEHGYNICSPCDRCSMECDDCEYAEEFQ